MEDDPLVGKWVEYPVKEHSDWDIYQAYLEERLARASEPDLDDHQTGRRDDGRQRCAQRGCGLDIREHRQCAGIGADPHRHDRYPRPIGSSDGSAGGLASQDARRLPGLTVAGRLLRHLLGDGRLHERADVRALGAAGSARGRRAGARSARARPLGCTRWARSGGCCRCW